MNENRSKRLADEELRYFGQVGASISHDINNILAIIGELNGLMSDLITLENRNNKITKYDKLISIVSRIDDQLKRGAGFAKQLNAFSHVVDHPEGCWNSAEVLQTAATLADRTARLKNVTLKLVTADNLPEIKGNLLDLQHIVFRAIQAAVQTTPKTSCLLINASPSENGLAVHFDAPLPRDDEQRLSWLLLHFGGQLLPDAVESSFRIILPNEQSNT